MTALIRIIATVAVILAGLGAVFMLGMRAQWPPVLNAIRRLNKAVFNPIQMKKAGTPGAYAGIIRHVGRTSGRPYETPISPMRAGGDFIVMLPYSTSPDWLKNVEAAGRAQLIYEGAAHEVDDPRVVSFDEARDLLPEKSRRTAERFDMDHFLLLNDAGRVT